MVEREAQPSAGRAIVGTFGATVVVAALSLVNVLLVSHVLGPTGRGQLVFLMTVAGLTGFILTLSVQEANANFVGNEPHSRRALASNSVVLAVLLGALGAVIVFSFGAVVPDARGGNTTGNVLVALVGVPFVILQNYLMMFARGMYAAMIANVALLVPPVSNLVVYATLYAADSLSVRSAIVTWVVTQGLSAGVLVVYVQSRLGGFGAPDLALSRRTVAFGIKSHGSGVMAAGNFRLDQWLLGGIAGPQQLGLYSIAVAWGEALFFLPTALALALRPNLVRADRRQAREQALSSVRRGLLVTVPTAVALFLLAPLLCVGLLGEEFRESIGQLRLLVPGAFGIVVLKLLGNALVAQGRPLLETAAIGVSLVATVVLDIALIPSFGGDGAAAASSIAYTVGGVAAAFIFTRALGGRIADLVPRRQDAEALVAMGRDAVSRIGAAPGRRREHG